MRPKRGSGWSWTGLLSWVVAVVVVVGGGCATRCLEVAGGGLDGWVDPARGEVVVEYRGQPVFVYAFRGNPYKPYVRELRTLRGENLLRDSPADHLHHHGLMYAIRANDVNFWEEREPAGRQLEDGVPVLSWERGAGGRVRAVVEHRLRWQPPGQDEPGHALLRERRRLVLGIDEASGEVALEWDGRFELGPGSERARLTGSSYNGLGLRLPESLDRVAEFLNPEGHAYSAGQTGEAYPARWSAVRGRTPEGEVTVGVASAKENAGTASSFTMRVPFAYLSATQDLVTRPLEYVRGEGFRVRYLLVAYPGARSAEELAGRFSAWRGD